MFQNAWPGGELLADLLVVCTDLVKTLVQHSGGTGSPIDSAHFSK